MGPWHLSGAPLLVMLLALPTHTHTRLSWKGLPGTNTLAYNKHSWILTKKNQKWAKDEKEGFPGMKSDEEKKFLTSSVLSTVLRASVKRSTSQNPLTIPSNLLNKFSTVSQSNGGSIERFVGVTSSLSNSEFWKNDHSSLNECQGQTIRNDISSKTSFVNWISAS